MSVWCGMCLCVNVFGYRLLPGYAESQCSNYETYKIYFVNVGFDRSECCGCSVEPI